MKKKNKFERDEMPRHNYDDKIEDNDVEKSYAYWPGQEPQPKDNTHVEGFTGGEWDTEFCLDGSIFVNSGDEIICAIQGEDMVITTQMEANAVLISQAPAMYKALKDIVNLKHEIGMSHRYIGQILSIAKTALQKANPKP